MKKRILALLLCVTTAASLVGCGSKDGETADATETVEDTQTAEQLPAVDLGKYDLKGEDYVTLCDYSAIPVTITGNYDVTDEDVQNYFEQLFAYRGPFYAVDDTKTTVEEGDIVNVDYVGKLDGEAFQGGTAENQNVDVSNNSAAGGSSSYIEGFTDDLLGASVGDVIDSHVTFPENYSSNTDLAGKEVVFTFTVNSIQKEITLEDVDDAFASENFGVDTLDEMYQQIREYLENTAAQNKTSDTYSAIEDYLLANCTIDVPEDYVADVIEAIRTNFINNYCGGDESKMEDTAVSYGYDSLDVLEKEWSDGVTSSIKLELVVKAIAAAEKIEIDEDEFTSYVDTIVSNNGYGSADALYSSYGYGDSVYGENQIRVIYLARLVLDKLSETAVITEAPAEAAESTESVDTTEAVETTEQ